MPFVIQYEDKDGYLLATVTGDCRTLKELADFGDDIIAASGSRKQTRVLMDFRGMIMELESYHIIIYTERMVNAGLPTLGLRLAALVDEKDIDIASSFETAFRNRSVSHKAFLDYEDAVAWLRPNA